MYIRCHSSVSTQDNATWNAELKVSFGIAIEIHCKNKIVVFAICLVTTIVCDCPFYADSKSVALVKHFVGG